MPFDPKELEKFPKEPGVYLMKGDKGTVLYVGKAKELKTRLKNYFSPHKDGRPLVPHLMQEVTRIETVVVFTEKEALILEDTLIKKYQPKYNLVLKDDKSFAYLMLNTTHPFPRLRLVRFKGKRPEKGLYFGPYTSALAARQTYELLTSLFPLRQCADTELTGKRTRPCLLYGMKRCIAPCVGYCTQEEYQSYVEKLAAFLQGKDEEILESLKVQMHKASERLEFEKAATYLRTISHLEELLITRKSGISFEDHLDVIGLFREADQCLIFLLFIRSGKIVGSTQYLFSHTLQEEEELITSFILQYYHERNDPPEEILLPVSIERKSPLAEILKERYGKTITLSVPTRKGRKELVDLAKKNARLTFIQAEDQKKKREQILLDLMEALELSKYPKTIECFDTSNLSGTSQVACMVTYTDGEYDKKGLRYFTIKTLPKGDDYGALREALTRRLLRAQEEDSFPDLILVDGGKGQLGIVTALFKELAIINIAAAALAKEEHKHTKAMTNEALFLPGKAEAKHFHAHSPLLFFLQNIRDKAHEKVLAFHKSQRKKKLFSSKLDGIPLIGPIKKKRLLQRFKSVEKIKEASDEELLSVEGISSKELKALREHLSS